MSSILKDKLESHFLHIYERSKSNKNIYRCIHPLCPYYQKKEFILGKLAECPSCHRGFILDRIQLRNKRPRCVKCSKSTKKNIKPVTQAAFDVEKTLKEMLNENAPKTKDEGKL